MVTVTQKVITEKLQPYYSLWVNCKVWYADTLGFYILHEGPLGVFDGTLREYDYDDVQETRKIEITSNGGWIGITDKYWLASGRISRQLYVPVRHSIENKIR